MSDDTLVADSPTPPPEGKPRMSTGDKVRFVLRGVGQTLITLGLIVLLFVVYEVWITNIYSRDENNQIASKLEQKWDNPTLGLPGGGAGTIPLGSGVANIYIPRLGADYHWTIVEGTGADELEKGPGHYTRTAGPGAKGNFGVAGHRVGKGEPFLNLDKLRVGDAVIVETKAKWFVYRVLGQGVGSNPQGNDSTVRTTEGTVKIPGREIVAPSAGRVLLPVPNNANAKPVQHLLTMTTCHPKFTAENRMIVHANLTNDYPAVDAQNKHVQQMPAAVKALYSQVTG